jgi:hypothetical protein
MTASGITFNREIASSVSFDLRVQRSYGNSREVHQADKYERVRIIRELLPRSDTRVLLVFGTASFERDKRKFFEECLRDHLGHVLLYLRSPKANNCCPEAMKEWRAMRVPRPRSLAALRKR